jgi:anti-anti-sigma factor
VSRSAAPAGAYLANLHLTVERPAPRTVVVRAFGELGERTAPDLMRLADDLLDARPGPVTFLLDLSGVLTYDPAGLAVLHRFRCRAAARGADFSLVGIDDRLTLLPGRVADALGVFATLPSVETALADGSGRAG